MDDEAYKLQVRIATLFNEDPRPRGMGQIFQEVSSEFPYAPVYLSAALQGLRKAGVLSTSSGGMIYNFNEKHGNPDFPPYLKQEQADLITVNQESNP